MALIKAHRARSAAGRQLTDVAASLQLLSGSGSGETGGNAGGDANRWLLSQRCRRQLNTPLSDAVSEERRRCSKAAIGCHAALSGRCMQSCCHAGYRGSNATKQSCRTQIALLLLHNRILRRHTMPYPAQSPTLKYANPLQLRNSAFQPYGSGGRNTPPGGSSAAVPQWPAMDQFQLSLARAAAVGTCSVLESLFVKQCGLSFQALLQTPAWLHWRVATPRRLRAQCLMAYETVQR